MIKQVFDYPADRASHVPTSRLRRQHRMDVARWGLANGRCLNRDALAVLVGTRGMNLDATISTTWSCSSVRAFLSWEAVSWCSTHRVRVPERLHETLSSYLRYLAHNRLLDPSSDPLQDLLSATEEFSTDCVGAKARSRHPTARTGTAMNYDNLVQLIPKKSSISSSPS